MPIRGLRGGRERDAVGTIAIGLGTRLCAHIKCHFLNNMCAYQYDNSFDRLMTSTDECIRYIPVKLNSTVCTYQLA